jgi:PAS domain S-box-containing protein
VAEISSDLRSNSQPPLGKIANALLGRFPEQAVIENLHTGETKILEMIAKGSPLTEVLDALTRLIEYQADGIHCALAFIDAELRIRPASAASMSPEYNGKLDGVPIFPYIGPCGMAAYLKQQVISENIQTDDRWSDGFRSLTKHHGLKACWSTPIFDSHQSEVGTFAVYLQHPCAPDSHHLKLIEVATRLAGIAIERRLREQRLHLHSEIMKRSTEAISILDPDGKVVEQNKAHREMFGIPDAVLKGQPLAALFGEGQSNHILESLALSENYKGELAITVKGQERLIEVSFFIVNDDGGKAVCYVDLSRDVTEKRKAEEALRSSHADLEATVIQRTVALRNLSQRLLKMQDEERRRVARELHDSTGQTLTALKMNVEVLHHQYENDERISGALSEIAAFADQALQEIRTTSYLLHPPLLDESGFASAARWYVEGFAKRSGIRVNLDLPTESERLPDSVEMVLFRVLQESLTNVHRHSGASVVDIQLNPDSKQVVLEVRDNGRGIPLELLNRLRSTTGDTGVGFAGMRERMHDVNGQIGIESGPSGTTIRVIVPLRSRPN